MVSNSPDETVRFGRKLGSQLRGGEIIAVNGLLGSGKTHLIRGIAAGAGVEQNGREVSSPTFVIVNEYAGRLNIYHIDVYRLDSVAEFEKIGFDDMCYAESVVVIEWADKVASALEGVECIGVELRHRGPSRREIFVRDIPSYISL